MKTWKPRPLHTAVAEILKEKGSLIDTELYDIVKESYEDVGFGKLNQTLMKMEILGRVSVSTLSKGRRQVELIEKKDS